MCLIVFANKVHKNYKLIFAANRDEFYNRPAEQAGFWKDNPELLAGKDLKAGGTWMGITKSGRFAAITNYRDMKNIKDNAPSRGKITLDYLCSDISAQEYFLSIKDSLKYYNGFNLILGSIDNLFYLSSIAGEIKEITPGIHALSNAFLDTPWFKVENSKLKLKDAINNNQISEESLMQILDDKNFAEIENLPDTGIGKDLEKVLSSIFIKTENYGTRCSTILLVDNLNNVKFVEKSYIPGENNFTRKEYNFVLK